MNLLRMNRLWPLLAFLLFMPIISTATPHTRHLTPACSDTALTPPIGPKLSLGLPDIKIAQASAPVTIDIIIGYVPAILKKFGESGTLEQIRRIVNFANQAHLNSGSGVSFRVVHIQPLSEPSSGNFAQDLQSATYVDGIWDELGPLRAAYGADMVSIIVDGSQNGTLCGLAYTNGRAFPIAESADFMVSIVSLAGSCPPSTFAHELGHNLGCQHDRANSSGSGAFDNSHGYTFTGNSKEKWHTIMAITADREIPFFSTPLLSFDGKAIGDAQFADNVSTLKATAPIAAELLPVIDTPDLALPVPAEPDTVSLKFKRSKDGRTIRITASLIGAGAPIARAPAAIYFYRGRKGRSALRAFGRTNSRGKLIVKENALIAPQIHYRACYLGPSPNPLCSGLAKPVTGII